MLTLKLDKTERDYPVRCLLCEDQPEAPIVTLVYDDEFEAGICRTCIRSGADAVETRLRVTRQLLATRLALTEELVEAINAGVIRFPDVLDVIRAESVVVSARELAQGKHHRAVVKADRERQGQDTVADQPA